MRGIPSYAIAALVGMSLSAGATTLPQSPSQQAQMFATCIGRLVALEEHLRHSDLNAASKTLATRKHFEALLDAVMPDALSYGMPEHVMWDRRVSAQQAHSLLLTRADYAADGRTMARAKQASVSFIEECQEVVPNA